MTKREVLEQIRQIVRKPYASVLSWGKSIKKKVVGYYPMDFPEELFYAAGFIPFAIYGSNNMPSKAYVHLQSFVDSLAKSFLHHGLAGDLEFLDALIITHIDDTTRALSSICKDSWPVPFFQDFLPPKRWDTPLAKSYLLKELRRLQNELEKFYQIKITEKALQSTIILYNRDRFFLREINRVRLNHPSVLSNRDFYDIVKASTLMPKEDHIALMEDLYHSINIEAKNGEDESLENSWVPILLTGYICEPSEIYDFIDSLKGIIVADDLYAGWRYFANDSPLKSDLMEGIADRLLGQPPSPFFVPAQRREDFLWTLAKRYRAKGVVFLQLKFCEAFNYDYPNLRDFFKSREIPTGFIETDLGVTASGQIRTYLETFFEMIRGI